MLETGFGLFCVVVIIGWFIAEGCKGAGRKISNLAAPHSGCAAFLDDDCKHYTLSYIGPKDHIESAWVSYGSAYNKVVSLEYDGKAFKAVAVRREVVSDKLIEKKIFEGTTVKQVAGDIEQQFKEWDEKAGYASMWKHTYT